MFGSAIGKEKNISISIFPSLAASYQKGWVDGKDIGNL
jgi:hypothetical protein